MKELNRLQNWFKGANRVLVAYSGGVDSTLVAYIAHRVLGEGALAVTFRMPLTDSGDVEDATSLAKRIGLNHMVMDVDLPDLLMGNPRDRCYICKKHLMERLKAFAKDTGYNLVVDGTNHDDYNEGRPGTKALQEEGIRSPLAELKIRKTVVRELSRMLGLNYQKPSNPCIATRFPYGYQMTAKELRMVSSAENGLRKMGFRVVRVRHFGKTAKIEVGREELRNILQDGVRERVVEELKSLGYKVVTIDLEGYRSGKMDDL
ncbi:MAG: ATP-dependent sacrificial sulfur transferase LarE [Candidatus Methanomethylicaceae archaeon]